MNIFAPNFVMRCLIGPSHLCCMALSNLEKGNKLQLPAICPVAHTLHYCHWHWAFESLSLVDCIFLCV